MLAVSFVESGGVNTAETVKKGEVTKGEPTSNPAWGEKNDVNIATVIACEVDSFHGWWMLGGGWGECEHRKRTVNTGSWNCQSGMHQ